VITLSLIAALLETRTVADEATVDADSSDDNDDERADCIARTKKKPGLRRWDIRTRSLSTVSRMHALFGRIVLYVRSLSA